jgi:uncharacterized protein (DUF58 family)
VSLLSPEFLARLAGLGLRTRKTTAARERGERRSRRRGRSVEFADYRDYARGDDVRFLDWNLLARLDRFFLKLYHDEDELRVHLLLDASRSMAFGEPVKFDHAVRTAAALGAVAIAARHRVRLAVLSEEGAPASPWLRGPPGLGRLFALLEAVRPAGRNALHDGVRRYVMTARPTGLLVLVSDLLDREGVEPVLRALVRPGLDVHLVQILALAETSPELAGDLRLVDSEERTGLDVDAVPRTLLAYRRKLAAYLAGIDTFALSRGFARAIVTTDVSVEDLVLRHLRERGLIA